MAEVIFRQFNFTKDVDKSHPDWALIMRKLDLIDDRDLEPFYESLFNLMQSGRNLERCRFLRAVEEHLEEKTNQVWAAHNIESRAKTLVAKLKTVAEMLESHGRQKAAEAAEREDFWVQIKDKRKDSPFFDKEELEVIRELGGSEAYELGRKLLYSQISSVEASRSHVGKAWKSVIVKKMLEKRAGPRRVLEGKSDTITGRVGDLISRAGGKISID